jgi:hypothetical protein
MAKVRSWEGLSDSYRARLRRAGFTSESYESGASVTAARGHTATPERPERAEKNPEKYAGYIQRKVKGESPTQLRSDIKKIGKRYGIADEILAAIPPSERAEFVSDWRIANAEYKKNKSKVTADNTRARKRMDDLLDTHPEMPRELGYYH